jgi:D-alanine-D-alanine ligase
MPKIRVGILFGGRSPEHEVALQSAKSIIEAIDKDLYDVVLIGIDKKGRWYYNDQSTYLLNANDPKLIALHKSNEPVTLVPWQDTMPVLNLSNSSSHMPIDVIFPVLHGSYGEDGTMQGLLKLSGIPFVGASVLGSAVGMDKDVMKRLLRDANLPITKFMVIHASNKNTVSFELVKEKVGLPCFVKPANAGSSVGVSKVKSEADFNKAITEAFLYDSKILVEEYIDCREIECAVLGNDSPKTSVPGEIIPHHEFYSYEAKYIDENGADLEIPANLSKKKMEEVQKIAREAFQTLCCEGMARVDFFMDKKTEKLYINEVNTIPGFTKISMYPKLWEASGISYTDLISQLISLALERHQKESNLKTTFT